MSNRHCIGMVVHGDSLFSQDPPAVDKFAPLAVRMRPKNLGEVVGQRHILGQGSVVYQMLNETSEHRRKLSMILWGPPGTGKTTLAMLVADITKDAFVELSATSAGVKDVRAVIEKARDDLQLHGLGTVLFIDEVHRFSKTQQDALLPAVENGWITLIAATTENPGFSIIAPLLSRSLVIALRSLENEDVEKLIQRAIVSDIGLNGRITVSDEALSQIVRVSAGDARRGLTVLDAAAAALSTGSIMSLEDVERAVAFAVPRYDRGGDQHYDVISAFIKSIRGSDVDAAMHYLARMVEAGEDPRFIARRLVILASEDIGMADPSALQTAVAAMSAVSFIGLPEAKLTLAHAVIHLSLAPKSRSVDQAITKAIDDVRAGLAGPVPLPLRDGSSSASRAEGSGLGYVYPHTQPKGIWVFDYAPEQIKDRQYYYPSEYGQEGHWGQVAKDIRNHLKK